MRIQHPGRVRDRVWFLGREESCVYLLEGEKESMLVSGGLSYLVPDILDQLRIFDIDESRITRFLILHAHFDHVGIVPFFKRRNPELEILASARGWEILRMPKAIQTINEFSRKIAERNGRREALQGRDLDWSDAIKGTPVSEGDKIDLGDLEVSIFETPGHSSCSISAYIPKWKVLFASDAGGIPYKDTVAVPGSSNFTQFQQSLERLKRFDVDFVCADHYGVVAGEEANTFIQKGSEAARLKRCAIEEAYRRTGDVRRAAKELALEHTQNYPDWVVSPEIVEAVFGQMVRHIASVPENPVKRF